MQKKMSGKESMKLDAILYSVMLVGGFLAGLIEYIKLKIYWKIILISITLLVSLGWIISARGSPLAFGLGSGVMLVVALWKSKEVRQ